MPFLRYCSATRQSPSLKITTRCHSVFSLRSPVALSFQLSEVATLKLAIGRPSWVRLISGSRPRLPTRITLLTEPAMTTSKLNGAAECAGHPKRHAACRGKRDRGFPHAGRRLCVCSLFVLTTYRTAAQAFSDLGDPCAERPAAATVPKSSSIRLRPALPSR